MAQQLRARSRALALGFAAALLLLPCTSSAQNVGTYISFVDRYASGDADAAVSGLSRWSRADVTKGSKEWARTAPVNRLCQATMLHTETAIALAVENERDGAAFHIAVAQGLIQRIVQSTNERDRDRSPAHIFALRWHELVASIFSGQAMLDDADWIIRSGLSLFPKAPMLYVARGVVREERVTLNAMSARGNSRGAGNLPILTPARLLDLAAADYRHAIEIDGARAITWLRLGWLHLRTGDARADRDFDTALEHADDDRMRYLSHLLRGLAAERSGRLGVALEEYDLALARGASFQTGYVAVSRVNEALGQREGARAVAQEYAMLEEKADDPWWDFNLGGFEAETLAWLRAEARRP
jgi:tetratricopeptide (TPR) repeat protein